MRKLTLLKSTCNVYNMYFIIYSHQARGQKFSDGGSFDTAGGLGAAQGSQKPLGFWCKILQSSNFQTLHSNFRKALFSITNF